MASDASHDLETASAFAASLCAPFEVSGSFSVSAWTIPLSLKEPIDQFATAFLTAYQNLLIFQTHGASLQTVGTQKISQVAQQMGTTAFMGMGAKAFVNVYTINNRQLLLLLAKLDDYLNACSTLKSGIDKANADLRASRNTIPHFPLVNGFSIEAYSIPVPDKKAIWDDLLNGFVTHANINTLLNPGSSYAAVTDALQPAINQVQADIDALFAKAPPARSPNAYQRQQADAHLLVDDVGVYLESQLHIWATALLGMIAAFSAVLAEAAKLNQPTVADLIYELNTPHSPDVMFEQLASGGLLVLVKGGTPSETEAAIQAYLSQFGYGRGTKITLMGYGKDGEATAQAVIQQAEKTSVPYTIVNAVMVGTDAKDNPDPTGIPVNYAFYNTKSEMPAALSNASSNSSDWGSFAGLSGKEWVFLGICAVISTVVPEVGVPLAEQYVVRTLLVKLGTNVVIDYAVDLGYNKAAAQVNPQAAAAYVANMVKAYQSAYNSGKPNVQVSINGGPVESLNTAIEEQNGLNLDLHGSNVKEYIDRYKSLPDEIGLNKTTLANDAYLGTQILNDPTKTGQAASFNASITPNATSSSPLTNLPTSGQTAGTPRHAVTHHVEHHCPPDEPEPATRPVHHRSGA